MCGEDRHDDRRRIERADRRSPGEDLPEVGEVRPDEVLVEEGERVVAEPGLLDAVLVRPLHDEQVLGQSSLEASLGAVLLHALRPLVDAGGGAGARDLVAGSPALGHEVVPALARPSFLDEPEGLLADE